jgi:hypothetical protein
VFHIGMVTGAQQKSVRIAKSVNCGMDLGCQPAPAPADCLFLSPPFPPALC